MQKFLHVQQILSHKESFRYLCGMSKLVKEDRVLRRLYPGRTVFTPEERAFAKRAIEAANSESVRSRIPRRDLMVGERFVRDGVEYECVLRPANLETYNACSGCDYVASGGGCDAPRCSKFDRTDGQFVWFRRVKWVK